MRGGRKMKSRNVKSKPNNTRKRLSRKTRRTTKRLSIGGNETANSLLPTPYQIKGIENGSSTPQQSALMAQRNADLQQNETNNLIGGDGEENNLPVVQFSGKNNAVTNQQSVELTNILASNRAAGVGDADVNMNK